ncbi:hypothetical protein KY349_04000 [Candidatus Woesearchaeota archaeon]|nr:hypothetical protein [Candidatus Woesearchaeota archaeon]
MKRKLFFGKRSQAAMEFLMTYGWAILVVLAAIVSLAYFGVLNPAKFFPESCALPSTTGMACIDFKVLPDSAHLLILNSGGRDYMINNVTIGTCSGDFSLDFPDGMSHLFDITGCSFGAVGQKMKENVLISYSDTFSGFTKTTSGSVSATIS